MHLDDVAAGREAEEAAHGAGEVAGIRHPLEPDDVGTEQALEDLLAPRQLGVDAVGRERDVVEEADDEVGAELAQHLGNELQLVVLHPDDGLGGGVRGRRPRRSAG